MLWPLSSNGLGTFNIFTSHCLVMSCHSILNLKIRKRTFLSFRRIWYWDTINSILDAVTNSIPFISEWYNYYSLVVIYSYYHLECHCKHWPISGTAVMWIRNVRIGRRCPVRPKHIAYWTNINEWLHTQLCWLPNLLNAQHDTLIQYFNSGHINFYYIYI